MVKYPVARSARLMIGCKILPRKNKWRKRKLTNWRLSTTRNSMLLTRKTRIKRSQWRRRKRVRRNPNLSIKNRRVKEKSSRKTSILSSCFAISSKHLRNLKIKTQKLLMKI